MRWEDERWVKVYTRDTGEWLALGWEAQALFLLLLRKSDRAGLLHAGRAKARGLAGMAGMPLEVVERALPLLLEDGCLRETEKGYMIPNFIAAQEAETSGAQRSRTMRERDRDKAMAEGIASKTAADTLARMARADATPIETQGDTHGATQAETQSATQVVTVLDTPRVDERRVEERTTLSANADRERPEDLQSLWNREAHAALPRWKDLTAKRRTAAFARLTERPLAEWVEVIRRISASPFCRGENDRGWKAGPEFLLRPNTATRVLEGEFSGIPKNGRGPAPPSRFDEPAPVPHFPWLDPPP